MKKLISLITLLVLLQNIFAYNTIDVKSVKFNIVFNMVPTIKNSVYTFKYLNPNKETYNKVLNVLERELNKYPQHVLSNYIAKDIYVVDDCYNTKQKQHINGISNKNMIILRFKVLNNIYYTNVFHHEIFHTIVANVDQNIVNNLLKHKLDNKCNYNKKYTENDYMLFNADFISNYHPNFEETSCELFSRLMYNDKDFKQNMSIPHWLINYDNNYKLKEIFMIVINFTKHISSDTMNLSYYYNINN